MSIVVDSSAVLAIVLREPDSESMQEKLVAANHVWMSPINLWEAYVRARALKGEEGEATLREIVEAMQIEIAEVREADALLAFGASKRFGGRPARLNLGDCFAYALARAKDAPLLFKGNDFASTDVKVA